MGKLQHVLSQMSAQDQHVLLSFLNAVILEHKNCNVTDLCSGGNG